MATLRQRKQARDRAMDAQARFDAGGFGRRINSWNPSTSGPQRRVAEGFERLRARAVDSVSNDWAASSSIQKWSTALVGVGIQPRWKNERHRELWDAFVPEADADGVLDAYGLQALQTTTWIASGECFVRRRPRDLTAPLEFPLQVQLLESDFLPLLDSDSYPGLPTGHTIRQGIERNKYGRRTAYWFYRDHPGDPASRPEINPDDLVRVAASEVSHIYEPRWPGALRGVTALSSVLIKLRGAMDFEDAVLDRQKLANLFVAFLKREMPPNWADVEVDPMTGLPKWYDPEGKALVGLQPGITQELQPGESIEFGSPPPPAASYPEYMRTNHLGTSAGQGLPYEFMSGDIKDISDRTLRIVVNEFRRFCEQRQWLTLIPMGCKPIVRWLAEAAVLAGKLPLSEFKEFVNPEWSPHGWEYIHPVQDVEAAIKERDAGFTSTSRVIAKRGNDPRTILAERKADEASGLTPKPPEPAAAAAGGPQPKAGPRASLEDDPEAQARTEWYRAQARLAQDTLAGRKEPEEPSAIEHFVSGLADVSASIGQVAASVAALAARPIEMKVDVAPAAVQVDNHVNPTPVQVQVDNHVPEGAAPVIHNHVPEGPAPVVHVDNVVNVEPAEVKVELPVRETVSDITRNLDGDIVKVIQVEKTLQ